MILLQYNHHNKTHKVLINGSFNKCLEQFDNLTEQYESCGIMMVKEINQEGTYIREFATTTKGHLLDLIICGGVATNVNSTIKHKN